MRDSLQITQLDRTPDHIHRFLMVHFEIYKDDPCWVAPILSDQKDVFSNKNPFFQHATMVLWVVSQGKKDVGRIAGIIDQNHNTQQNDRAAFFGFFESINDPKVSHLLFEEVKKWARGQGMQRVLGPMNPSNNDECGLLIDGFDTPPVFMMTHNLPYYQHLVEKEGYGKAKDLIAYIFNLDQSPFERLERIASCFGQRQNNVTVRPILKKTLQQDLHKIKEVYNSAWENNWGFVSMTSDEVDYMAKRLMPLFREGLVWMAETPEEPAAFILAVPDFNQVFKRLNGRLLSLRILRCLPYLLGWKQPSQVRVVALGIKKKFRGRGIESVMFAEGLKYAVKAGYRTCEASWILEDNTNVQRVIDLFGGKPYKKYRIFDLEI